MKIKIITSILYLLFILGCREKHQTESVEKELNKSQYVVESNTIIFYDRSINDAIKSKKFYKCIDVFTSAVTAKVTDNGGTSKTYRVVSLIYDENKILNIDTRQDMNYTSVDFFIMGYAEASNPAESNLAVIQCNNNIYNIELMVKGMKTDINSLMNLSNNSQNVMADQIVFKKSGMDSEPHRKMNVFHSDLYAKNFTNNSTFKIVDIYRPSIIDRNFTTPPSLSTHSWFATGLPITPNKDISNGNMVYIKNPAIYK